MMLTIKEIKSLCYSSKRRLLRILLLSWMLGRYAQLQAISPTEDSGQSIADRLQESPFVPNIWEGQIGATLGGSAIPFFPPTVFNELWAPPVPPWEFVPPPFVGNSTSLIYNNLGNNPNIPSHNPPINSLNPLESSFYNFPTSSLPLSNSFPLTCQPHSGVPLSDTDLFSPNSLKLSLESSNQEDKPVATVHANPLVQQSKICIYCGKKFPKKGNLEAHIRVHTNEKPYQCTYCHKRFKQQGNLKRHLRIHTNDKPFHCIYCSKKFTRQNYLITHTRVHTKEKPFQCDYCYKKFSQKSNLTTHIRVHTKEKPYQCAFCGKKFSQKSNLTTHTKSQHN